MDNSAATYATSKSVWIHYSNPMNHRYPFVAFLILSYYTLGLEIKILQYFSLQFITNQVSLE